jgi:septal ring factor EnvC (AmiA/AmiB activator)
MPRVLRDITLVRLVGFLLTTAVAAGAQQNPPTPPATPTVATAVPAQSIMPASAADTNEIIIVARSADTVRTEKDRLLSERRDAETRWLTLREQTGRLRASISEVKNAIDAAANRSKAAKKEKRDTDRALAEVEKRRLERSLALLDARYDLRAAQSEQAKVERDYLDASIRSADAEGAIAERRQQVLPDDPSQRSAFNELTSRWLQALRTRAARAYDLEDRRFKVVEAQMELLKRQRA